MSATPLSLDGKRVWVAGHRGMVGSALLRRLEREPVADVVTASSAELDLRRQEPTERFVERTRPDVVILAAARVGGIEANRTRQAEFLYDNLMIAANVIEAARVHDVGHVVMLGSSCVYPREAPQPMAEDALLTGPLEETNEGYAIAKIAGLELARMYRRQHGMAAISLMPTNLYGPQDDFDPVSSHVLPGLLGRMHTAARDGTERVRVWGSGRPRREFLHVDDLADATLHVLRHHDGEEPVNVGWGRDISIAELAALIAEVVGFEGELEFDTSMPDGTPRKLLDTSRLTGLGWRPRIGLREGIEATYAWYLEDSARRGAS